MDYKGGRIETERELSLLPSGTVVYVTFTEQGWLLGGNFDDGVRNGLYMKNGSGNAAWKSMPESQDISRVQLRLGDRIELPELNKCHCIVYLDRSDEYGLV